MMARAVVRRWLASCSLSACLIPAAVASAQAPVALEVDVLAVDRDGRPVADLRASDFEVRDGGRSRAVRDVRYVAGDAARTVVFVVDDLALSFDSVNHVRRALARYVEDHMAPSDRVAIVHTGADSNHPLTADKKLLRESVARVRYNGLERGRSWPRWSIGRENSALGTVRSLQSLLPSLSKIEGRKAVVLFSDGIGAFGARFGDPRVEGALRDVAAAANRASVVIYTVDGRGLDATPVAWNGAFRFYEQGGLAFLAQETGGQFLWNTDVPGAVKKLMSGEAGHYVVRYETDAVRRAGERSVQVRVTRPGVKVRTRSAVFAPPSGDSI